MKVLGLNFYEGLSTEAVASAKGLCVFPSAPGLATMPKDPRYTKALLSADTCYADSGFLALSWFLVSGESLLRYSGLRFLQAYINSQRLFVKKSLWIHPSDEAQERNHKYLAQTCKIPSVNLLHYTAPHYPVQQPLIDEKLLLLCKKERPEVVVVGLGSNTQEPLGAYLKANLDYAPLILCTGGAIDFITGAQANIPEWADRMYLGWLFRVLGTPKKQAQGMRISPAKRYWDALSLFPLLLKHRRGLPCVLD